MPSRTVKTPSDPFAPAGWYADPLGVAQLRWWNGLMWTDRVQNPSLEPTDSLPYKVDRVRAP